MNMKKNLFIALLVMMLVPAGASAMKLAEVKPADGDRVGRFDFSFTFDFLDDIGNTSAYYMGVMYSGSENYNMQLWHGEPETGELLATKCTSSSFVTLGNTLVVSFDKEAGKPVPGEKYTLVVSCSFKVKSTESGQTAKVYATLDFKDEPLVLGYEGREPEFDDLIEPKTGHPDWTAVPFDFVYVKGTIEPVPELMTNYGFSTVQLSMKFWEGSRLNPDCKERITLSKNGKVLLWMDALDECNRDWSNRPCWRYENDTNTDPVEAGRPAREETSEGAGSSEAGDTGEPERYYYADLLLLWYDYFMHVPGTYTIHVPEGFIMWNYRDIPLGEFDIVYVIPGDDPDEPTIDPGSQTEEPGQDGLFETTGEGKPEVFDLNGRRVVGNPAPGVYILVRDGKAVKTRF